MVQTFNAMGHGTGFTPETLKAHITVIPKEDKDPSICGSYRPISLLNVDLKLFTKILATRIQPHLTALVHPDQVGFIPTREARDNTIKILNLVHVAGHSKTSTVFLGTDAEKAFDQHSTYTGIKYLGTLIPPKLDQTFELNFPPLLSRVKVLLSKWHQGLFSWFGRCNIIKMSVLPKFSYLFQTLPIHIPPELSSALKKHPTLGPTLRICSRICSTTLLSSVNSPLYPNVWNLRFPPGLQEGPFRKLSDSQCFQASHFIQKMLRHFLNTLPPPDRFQRTLTPLEQLCEGTGPCSHLISQMYALLVAPQEDYVPPYIRKWEMTLDRTFTQAQHRQIVNLALKSSISTRIQETNFKIMTRCYRTPSLLNKYFPEIPDKCWRCQEERGTLLHVLWSCPKLEYFWRDVRWIAQKFTEYNLPEDPALFLLHVSNIPRKTYSKLILRHLINAARSCIVRQWRDTSPPTKCILRIFC